MHRRMASTVVVAALVMSVVLSAEAKTRITVMVDNMGGTRWDSWAAFYPAFGEKHPDLEVEITEGANAEKIAVLAAAGTLPDIVYVHQSDGQTYIDQGIFRPLNHFVSRSGFNPADFFPTALLPYSRNGQFYAFPYGYDPIVAFYNTDHLEQAGLPRPDLEWTHEQMRQYAKKLTQMAMPLLGTDSMGRQVQERVTGSKA